MTLEQFQSLVIEHVEFQSSSKEKIKSFYYTIYSVNEDFLKLDEICNFNLTNTTLLINQLGNAYTSVLVLLKEFNFPINSEEFSLEEYKNNIRNFQTISVVSINNYLLPIKVSLSVLNNLAKKLLISKNELELKDKYLLINILYDLLTKGFLLADNLGFNIDIILQKHIDKLQKENIKK